MAFPVVPIAPGVPPLPRDPLSVVEDIVLLAADALSVFAGSGSPQWGLFDQDGGPVVTDASVVSFENDQQWSISDYPVEEGGFESYDKVSLPFQVHLRFAAGRSTDAREQLINDLDAIAGTTTLHDVVTPEKIYIGVNVNRVSYRRTATNGVGLLQIDVACTEVRTTATASFSNSTKSPTDADAVNNGQVQPTTPTTDQEDQVRKAPIAYVHRPPS